jgi:hypothetical protein
MHILSILIVALLTACSTVQQNPTPVTVQDEIKPLEQIAFGSCTRQMQDAPLLNTIVSAKPDLFLMIGDVVYPDINDEATALLDPWDLRCENIWVARQTGADYHA